MKVVGIIAEYNPFHKGHEYQIRYAREILGADYIVVAMSGDFVQRGAPALMEKHLRAEMALLGGADLVLELPIQVSTASAESGEQVKSMASTHAEMRTLLIKSLLFVFYPINITKRCLFF